LEQRRGRIIQHSLQPATDYVQISRILCFGIRTFFPP
jgi:hypothetical protein